MSKKQNSLNIGSFFKKEKSDPNIWNQISYLIIQI